MKWKNGFTMSVRKKGKSYGCFLNPELRDFNVGTSIYVHDVSLVVARMRLLRADAMSRE